MADTAYEDLNNPDLFTENAPGEYTYTSDGYGKTASGQLTIPDEVARDSAAQRAAGGDARRTAGNEYGVDDGGHLIGARFGGSTGEENLTAQDRNINRGQYKQIENSWARHLEQGDKVYVNLSGYDSQDSGRPSNYMGYAIIEHSDGSREIEYYSVNNESQKNQEAWDQAETEYYTQHPEAVQQQQQENTAMPFIWDDEKGEAVPNPNYKDADNTNTNETTQTTNAATEFEPEVTAQTAQNTAEFEPEGTAQTTNAAAEFEPEGEVQSTGTENSGPAVSADYDNSTDYET